MEDHIKRWYTPQRGLLGEWQEAAWRRALSVEFLERQKGGRARGEGIRWMVEALFKEGKDVPEIIVTGIGRDFFYPIATNGHRFSSFLECQIFRRLEKEDSFVACAVEALSDEGEIVYIPQKTVLAKEIIFSKNYTRSQRSFFHRMHIFVGRGSRVTFVCHTNICKHFVGSLFNFIDLFIDGEAEVTWIEDRAIAERQFFLDVIRVNVKTEGVFSLLGGTCGISGVCRRDIKVDLLENDSKGYLRGGGFLCGDAQEGSHICIQHKAPRSTSIQHFKYVVDDCSRSSFVGESVILSAAQKSNASQLNHNFLLGEASRASGHPVLKVFADDVKASHGMTFSTLSERELFYLQSRGIAKEEAKLMFVHGFLRDIFAYDNHNFDIKRCVY